jgi:hypothetical protein
MQLADPAVANQLAGMVETRVRTLLASDLKDSIVAANRITQDPSFPNG